MSWQKDDCWFGCHATFRQSDVRKIKRHIDDDGALAAILSCLTKDVSGDDACEIGEEFWNFVLFLQGDRSWQRAEEREQKGSEASYPKNRGDEGYTAFSRRLSLSPTFVAHVHRWVQSVPVPDRHQNISKVYLGWPSWANGVEEESTKRLWLSIWGNSEKQVRERAQRIQAALQAPDMAAALGAVRRQSAEEERRDRRRIEG
jgi:hypothetical protein